MERHDVDTTLKRIRASVIKGAKSTRHGRLKGCFKRYEIPCVGQTVANVDTEATTEDEEGAMTLSEAIANFRAISEERAGVGEWMLPAAVARDLMLWYNDNRPKVNANNWWEKAKAALKAKRLSGSAQGYFEQHKGRFLALKNKPIKFIAKAQAARHATSVEGADIDFAKAMLEDRVGDLRNYDGVAEITEG